MDANKNLSQSANANLRVTINGTNYDINNDTLATWTGGATKTNDDLLAFFKDKLSTGGDGSGAKLASVADISFDSAGKLTIINKTAGAAAIASVTVTNGDNVAGDKLADLFNNDTAQMVVTAGADTGATAADQARSLRVALNANSTINTGYTAYGTATSAEIAMKENPLKATGTALEKVTVAGAGTNDKLMITNTAGQNLMRVKIVQNTGNDSLAVDETNGGANDGTLLIKLAEQSAYKNTAEEIQNAVQANGQVNYTIGGKQVTVDYSKYEFGSEGNWDTVAIGANITKDTGTMVGGTQEARGDYSLNIDKAFATGDKVLIKGQFFTAVEGQAIASKGEFSISSGNVDLQAASLRDAISLNSALKDKYTAGGVGAQINLVEKTASGIDLVQSDLDVRASGTAGVYTVNPDQLLENGAKFIVDGEEITVSNKESHVGYSNGTAIKVAASVADQTKELVDAINKNTNLSQKYIASVATDGSLTLTQKELNESSTAPVVSTKSSPLGKFEASIQTGANSGQSTSIKIEDMRTLALGISGDGSGSTVKAKNGFTASYVATANVTDGTSNENTQYALDVSTYEKATAAISVINDAIQTVSAQRSQIGSLQNRLDHTINNLSASSENLTTAESRIRDVDMAKEMMEFTKNNILSQAAQAMLAQANQQPQQVLQLLR